MLARDILAPWIDILIVVEQLTIADETLVAEIATEGLGSWATRRQKNIGEAATALLEYLADTLNWMPARTRVRFALSAADLSEWVSC